MSIRSIPLVVVVAAALMLAAAPAAAKVIEEAAVCGAAGCTEVKLRGDAHAMLDGGAVSAAPALAPFYTIRLGIGDGSGKVFERFPILYVPSADKMLAMPDGRWMTTTAAAERALDRVTRGHKPYPAKRLANMPGDEPTETIGTSLPPEVVAAPTEVAGSGEGGGGGAGVPAWLIVLAAGGGLVLVAGGVTWTVARRPDADRSTPAPSA